VRARKRSHPFEIPIPLPNLRNSREISSAYCCGVLPAAVPPADSSAPVFVGAGEKNVSAPKHALPSARMVSQANRCKGHVLSADERSRSNRRVM